MGGGARQSRDRRSDADVTQDGTAVLPQDRDKLPDQSALDARLLGMARARRAVRRSPAGARVSIDHAADSGKLCHIDLWPALLLVSSLRRYIVFVEAALTVEHEVRITSVRLNCEQIQLVALDVIVGFVVSSGNRVTKQHFFEERH